MFKSLEYVGFADQPELKAKAEQLIPVLADEIRRWREDVEVLWTPAGSDTLELTLSLTIAKGISGSQTGTLEPDDFAEAWLVRRGCRDVWASLLWALSVEMETRIEEALSDPPEAPPGLYRPLDTFATKDLNAHERLS